MIEVALEESEPIFPLAVDDVPDVHLLLLGILQHLDLIVEVFDRSEAPLAQFQSAADLAIALLLHFYIQSLLSLGSLHTSNQIN